MMISFLRRTNSIAGLARRFSGTSLDYYSVLGVTKKATVEEVRNAYMRLAAKSHPDVLSDKAKGVSSADSGHHEAFSRAR